jgi:murein DD-endopeptidase MepM/ murein hydrolase activator NlpD
MKGVALRCAPRCASVLLAWLACAPLGVADDVCSPNDACAQESAAPREPMRAPLQTELGAAAAAAPDARSGGGRAARSSGPPPAGAPALAAAMDRRAWAVGEIDPDHDDQYEYRLPYGDAESYPVIQGYGARLSHRGTEQYTVDFGMPVGTPVHAAREGVVALAEDTNDVGCWREECGRLANFIVLLHADGTTGEYFHLRRGSAQVRVGQRVERGELLAFSGNTGYTTAPHLHFGVYRTESNGETQSIAVRFVTRGGVIREPRTGARYLNIARR